MVSLQHNFKKVRNNILKSTLDGSGTRCLTVKEGSYIVWKHFVNAFMFDQREFSMSYHKKLTIEHFELNPASKMRNHLAEDVLDVHMLHLMKVRLIKTS